VVHASGTGWQLQQRTSHAMFLATPRKSNEYTAAENEVTALMYMIGIYCFSSKIRQTLP